MHRFNTGMCLEEAANAHVEPVESYFSGFKNKDVAFFHQASKTMIEADLLFNLPATEQVRLHCTCTECLCYKS